MLGLKEHVGAGVPPPVMLLQLRLTVPLKPFIAEIVIVEVADAPAVTDDGESGVAERVKSIAVSFTLKKSVASLANGAATCVVVGFPDESFKKLTV